MPNENQPSFSRSRRWKIGLDMAARTVLVLAVVVMVNFLGAQFFHRFYLSSQTRIQLSSRTVSVLHSLTNRIAVTLYYDRHDDFYPDIAALLNEYHAVNPKVSFQTVDYVRDAGEAEKVKKQYKQFFPAQADKNLIIFDAGNNRVKVAPGVALTQVKLEAVPNDKEPEFRRKPVAFLGEMEFTSILIALESSRQFNAYYLGGHGEPALDDSDVNGYLKFASILRENYINVQPLHLLGAQTVPMDCNLLVIAGPRDSLSEMELQKIDQYLSQGGRLFVLLNFFSSKNPSGLEKNLARWDVNVGADTVRDPDNHYSDNDVVLLKFSDHPVVNPLTGLALEMVLPRPVGEIQMQNPPPDAPKVNELAFTGPNSTLANDPAAAPRSYSLMAAVEQKNTAGVVSPRGTTRIIAVGDSFLFDNQLVDVAANRDLLGYAINWLLERPQLLEGIGPRPVTEFRLLITEAQQREIRWALLGALPGAMLLFGGLVWLVRRK